MWIFSTIGFYAFHADAAGMVVAGRIKAELEALKSGAGIRADVKENPESAEYRWQMTITHAQAGKALGYLSAMVPSEALEGALENAGQHARALDLNTIKEVTAKWQRRPVKPAGPVLFPELFPKPGPKPAELILA